MLSFEELLLLVRVRGRELCRCSEYLIRSQVDCRVGSPDSIRLKLELRSWFLKRSNFRWVYTTFAKHNIIHF